MSSQKDIFLASEANEWYERNKKAYTSQSKEELQLVRIFDLLEMRPQRILEIGCSTGIRLNEIQKSYQCEAFGLDPSSAAIDDGKKLFPSLDLSIGTAESLNYQDSFFDVIVFGFCLYLCDRKDLFTIAKEANRCLKDNGYIVIKDFAPPIPFKNNYSHKDGVFSYKMNYGAMFTWNPDYNIIFNSISSHSGASLRGVPNEKIGVTVLHKNEQMAYVTEPYK